MPYLEKAGLANGEGGEYVLSPFDFRVKGVTSISCDTHKVTTILYVSGLLLKTLDCSMASPPRFGVLTGMREHSHKWCLSNRVHR